MACAHGRILALRGVRSAQDASAFLDSEIRTAAPALPDLEPAVERLARACRSGETVAVFGDFDVDGVTAAAILSESLTSLGAKPLPYLPHRVDEGYGLNTNAIASLRDLGATLLVTADCGTSSIAEVAFATSLAMDVIILDHHTVPPQLPIGALIVNPKRDEHAVDEPSAGGIAHYVMLALHEAIGKVPDEGRMLELAALSTVCDMAPLTGENRRLVRDGLRALACTERPGLIALMECAGVDRARCDTESIAFALGPRLNAAGRMAHARLAFDLLTAPDEDTARPLAAEIDALNRERRQAQDDALALAEELLAEEDDAPLIMIGHPDFPLGIVGLVASRLVESRHRPAIVYQLGDDESRASARSIHEFHVTDALRECPELFVRFGGHRAAAGFTATNDNLPEIKERLIAAAERELSNADLSPVVEIDAEVPLSSLRGEEIRWLRRLAPHGQGNPEPVFLSRNATVLERKTMGADDAHLRLKLRDGNVTWPAIAFRQTGEGIVEGERADVVYAFSQDRIGNGALELRVLDVRPSGA